MFRVDHIQPYRKVAFQHAFHANAAEVAHTLGKGTDTVESLVVMEKPVGGFRTAEMQPSGKVGPSNKTYVPLRIAWPDSVSRRADRLFELRSGIKGKQGKR